VFSLLLFTEQRLTEMIFRIQTFRSVRQRIEIRIEPHLLLQFLTAMFVSYQKSPRRKVSLLDPALSMLEDFLQGAELAARCSAAPAKTSQRFWA
jgi:hypothetical protein